MDSHHQKTKAKEYAEGICPEYALFLLFSPPVHHVGQSSEAVSHNTTTRQHNHGILKRKNPFEKSTPWRENHPKPESP